MGLVNTLELINDVPPIDTVNAIALAESLGNDTNGFPVLPREAIVFCIKTMNKFRRLVEGEPPTGGVAKFSLPDKFSVEIKERFTWLTRARTWADVAKCYPKYYLSRDKYSECSDRYATDQDMYVRFVDGFFRNIFESASMDTDMKQLTKAISAVGERYAANEIIGGVLGIFDISTSGGASNAQKFMDYMAERVKAFKEDGKALPSDVEMIAFTAQLFFTPTVTESSKDVPTL